MTSNPHGMSFAHHKVLPWKGRGAQAQETACAAPIGWALGAARKGELRRVVVGTDALAPEVPPEMVVRLAMLIEATSSLCPACYGSRVLPRIPFRLGLCAGQSSACREVASAPAVGLRWLLPTRHPRRWSALPEWVRPFVALGAEASTQAEVDELVPPLMGAQGFGLRWLLLEPLLEEVELQSTRFSTPEAVSAAFRQAKPGQVVHSRAYLRGTTGDERLGWVVVRGDMGNQVRPCDISWVRALLVQGEAALVGVFVDRLGGAPLIPAGPHPSGNPSRWDKEWPLGTHFGNPHRHLFPAYNGRVAILRAPGGTAPAEWPEDLRRQPLSRFLTR